MTSRMLDQEVDHLWLDATALDDFDARFPTIADAVHAIGLDPARDWLPIAPAAHHLAGGVVTDLDGASSVPGLWAACEVACTGVHGANRLASNSLLEGMVFAPRAVEAIVSGKEKPEPSGAMRSVLEGPGRAMPPLATLVAAAVGPEATRAALQQAMTRGAGVVRSAASLIAVTAALTTPEGDSVAAAEVRNLVTVGEALIASALARTESRGCHWREDHPQQDPALRMRLVHNR
jgi:L-aspartate oxidase